MPCDPDPLPLYRPAVTATAVGDLAVAGFLLRLGGDPAAPDVHADQVAALGRRRDLPALLDRHVLLGPDQAAVRLGARRTEVDHAVRLGWLRPARTTTVDFGRDRGGEARVAWFRAEDVALVPVVHTGVDWRAVRRLGPGRRSPLAGLEPVVGRPEVTLAAVARIARVGRAAVVNWRRRHDDFPAPTGGTAASPMFDPGEVVVWLLAHGKVWVPHTVPSAVLVVRQGGDGTHTVRVDDPLLTTAEGADGTESVDGWVTAAAAEALDALAEGPSAIAVRSLAVPGRTALAVSGDVRLTGRHDGGRGRVWVALSWRAGLRGEAGQAGHAVSCARGADCRCAPQECGGIVPARHCLEHGVRAAPAMEWHPAGGIRCGQLRSATVPVNRG
ncbi:hypothetical protein [Streptomyces xanthophaeus]